jgi:hypothetical protein
MNGNALQSLKRRLMEGDNDAQRLAWQLSKADEPTKQRLLEEHQDLVEQHQAAAPEREEHPTLEF